MCKFIFKMKCIGLNFFLHLDSSYNKMYVKKVYLYYVDLNSLYSSYDFALCQYYCEILLKITKVWIQKKLLELSGLKHVFQCNPLVKLDNKQ